MVVSTRVIMPDIEEINKVLVFTERVRKRKQEYLAARPHVSAERSRLATQSWKETEGQPVVIRRARLFKNIMEGIPVVIRESELVVGSQTRYVRGANVAVDWNPRSVIKEISAEKITSSGEYTYAEISDEERKSILSDAQYWLGKSPVCGMRAARDEVFGSIVQDLIDARILCTLESLNLTARGLDFEKLLNKGVRGVMEEIREERQRLVQSPSTTWTKEETHKLQVLDAGLVALESVTTFARRHAQLARELAAKETNNVRKKELEQIAETCERVPDNPAGSFREAVQSFWFAFLALNLETGGDVETPGRFDQYMYPFYEKDVQEGRMTRQEAGELLGCLWVKFVEMDSLKEDTFKERTQGSQFMNLTIGGINKNGEDATNELSYLLLDVIRQVKVNSPHVTLRYHDGLSEAFLLKAIETNRDIGAGIPQFINDKVTILNLVEEGIPLWDARNWAGVGCAHPFIPDASGSYGKSSLNGAKIFELTLYNGVDTRTGKQLGLRTGDPRSFTSFEELYDAFKKQFSYLVDLAARLMRLHAAVRMARTALPYNSALMNDCMKKGLDVLEGGTRYPAFTCGFIDRGHVNMADSLVAVKKLVFEEKKITIGGLLDGLASNFEGKEDLRQMLLAAPKFGNDNDEADKMMSDLWFWTAQTVKTHSNIWGKCLTVARHGTAYHYWAGKVVGALPDGRKARTPLADGGVSPMAGRDTRGPTAVLNSISKLDGNACEVAVLNQKFPPAVLQTKEGMKKLLALIKTFFDRYGYHIQFNILDKKTLLDAKKHPEKYRELLVRVAGYSAYFVELSPDLQDEIIARTEQGL
ncbi:MAG: hypothetical protein HYX82_03050 [Chloroflexi bacterium]|nr:hypothetical protein [Chloroflexota bacterium]